MRQIRIFTSTFGPCLTRISACTVVSPPGISVEPRAATVRQGESVSFRCQVGSDAVEPVEWKRANNQALQGQRCTSRGGKKAHLRIFTHFCLLIDNVKIGPGGFVLTITNARPGNQGQYHCTVQTATGRKSATAALNVKCELQIFHRLTRNNYLVCWQCQSRRGRPALTHLFPVSFMSIKCQKIQLAAVEDVRWIYTR